MENKKQSNDRLIKVALSTLVFVGGIGFTIPNIKPVTTFANADVKENKLNNKQVVNLENTWRYLDNNVDPADKDESKSIEWTKPEYSDDSWKSASGTFGAKKGVLADLGDGANPTVLLNQYYESEKDIPTYFFRTKFNIENLQHLKALVGTLKADDGVIVYVNGIKITEANISNKAIIQEPNMYYAGTGASSPQTLSFNIDVNDLVGVLNEGENTLAVELHNDRESSSDIYFDFSNLTLNYEEEAIIQKAISLTVGENETQNNLTWYANTSDIGEVQVAKKDSVINEEFPASCQIYMANSKPTDDGSFYSNQTTINNLESNSEYAYRVINGKTVSDIFTFKTGNFNDSFNFILAGDPQIGTGGNAEVASSNWSNTLEKSVAQFNPSFLISAGDQVNTASNESEYSGYLNASSLTSLPSATTIGNHDNASKAYQDHFNLPNENDEKGVTTAGSDYWYVYNNTLFMDINSNNKSTAEHKAFMEEAITKNPEVRWKTVIFHHSVYSTASHTNDGDIVTRRNELPPVFSELGIDVVLQGHDHVYTRTYMMNGVVPDTTNGVQSSVSDPTGVLYLTANSASGSKYYDIAAPDAVFAAKMDQSKKRTITDIKVSDNAYTLTTYFVDDMSVLDTFTINKTPLTNSKEEILKPDENSNVSIGVSIKAAIGAIKTGASLNAKEENDGPLFNTVKEAIKQLLGSEKEFKLISLEVMKDNQISNLNGNIEVTFDLAKEYDLKNIKLYRYQPKERSNLLQEIDTIIKDGKLTLETNQLGSFVIVNHKSNVVEGDGNQEATKPEIIPNEKPSLDTTDKKETITSNVKAINAPSTGDTTNIMQLFILLIVGISGSVIVIQKNKK